ncbi:low molecular weight protein-tyrosine-phosphatase [Raineya orbicola]|jgi:protein-tyrosine phosphatase|uniref:Protein-tyrosine-phosphatase n=1 Tax=Raineya orbicola TaxID=2016530 RepID=A0A2N3III6_9BACT|nr:low molecular weight protein-tyrosine-phosphatase [Raineya orbicola]PKQ70160.1 Protein-tyrosine-phosphatase [Raineya orbicola]
MKKVLFVCLGNICRSPLAEGIFKKLIEEAGLQNQISVDSAGTSSYHIGELPDYRTCQVAEKNGIILTHRARQVRKEDFLEFDYILAADKSNLQHLQNLQKQVLNGKAKVCLIRDWEGKNLEVPDPYYGTMRDFEDGYALLEKSLKSFLDHLLKTIHQEQESLRA